MIEITTADVLDEIDSIGMEHDNDYNDGDGPFGYSSFGVDYEVWPPLLRFVGITDDGVKHEYVFELREVTH